MKRSLISSWRPSPGLAVALLLPLAASCGSGVEPVVDGVLRVDVSTTGENQDADGYFVMVGLGVALPVDNNGSLSYDPISPGVKSVTISDVEEHCDWDGGPGRNGDGNFTVSATVVAGETEVVNATFVCS